MIRFVILYLEKGVAQNLDLNISVIYKQKAYVLQRHSIWVSKGILLTLVERLGGVYGSMV